MVNILLINPPVREHENPTVFPLGMAYIAGALRSAGHNIEIFDIDTQKLNKAEVEERIKDIEGIDLIGTGGLITRYSYVKFICEVIRKYHSIPIMVGGSLAASIPELMFNKTKADILIFGEGEGPAINIANAIRDKQEIGGIKGTWVKKDGQIIKGAMQERCLDLDNMPFPAYDLFNIDAYSTPIIYEGVNLSGKRRKLFMLAGRGCPQRCAFCYRNFGRMVVYRNPDKILEEMKLLHNVYNISFIEFLDETFTIKKSRVLEICKKIRESGLDIQWACSTRVNLVDEEMLKAMKEAGCVFINIGIESGSQKMLDLMHKDIKVEQSKRAVELCRKAGIFPNPSFMIGFPGETKETIKETVEFCKEMDLNSNFFITTPYPGTEIYPLALEKGLIKDEEEFVLKLSETGDAYFLNINMTDMSDEELRTARREAYNEVLHAYFKKHKIYALRYNLFRINIIIKGALNIYKKQGSNALIKAGKQKFREWILKKDIT